MIFRQQETAYGTSVIMKQPVSGKFFRLEEAEYFIARQLDGQTPVETIRQRTEAKFGGELPAETLYAFLHTLKKNGVLETSDPEKEDTNRRQKRFRGSPLYCRFKVFDPCQLLKRLVRRTGFFYTPYFGVLSATAILLGVGITIANWGDLRHHHLPRLYHASAIPLILALNFLVVGAHEFGHGLTCTRFGGEVHEMGCALVFLQPAFYCNVSDAWLFPEKSKRLWVGFAGPYFELFLWALATLTWQITEANTWVNFAALCVMATSGVKTLLNFNPLIKLDGYYLLSDYLEMPNLRRRSFRYVGNMVERVFGLGSPLESEENTTRRERWIMSVYGTIALAGSFSILGYILVSAGGSLVAGRTPTAVLISLGLLGMKFRRRFRRMFNDPTGAAGSFDDEDFDTGDEASDHLDDPAMAPVMAPVMAEDNGHFTFLKGINTVPDAVAASIGEKAGAPRGTTVLTEPTVADNGNGFKESSESRTSNPSPKLDTPSRPNGATPPSGENGLMTPDEISAPEESAKPEKKKPRHVGRWIVRTFWLALAATAVAALFYLQPELQVGGPLNILPVRNADIRTEIDGLVEKIFVTEGASVRKGQLVGRLSIRENRSELEKTHGQIQQSSARLRLQVAGPTPDEIELAKTAVVKAKDNLNFARVKLEAMKELFANHLAARLELDTAEQQYATAKDDLDDAQGKLKVLQNGTRSEEIDATKAEISGFQAQQHFLEGQIQRADIRSPVDGIIATPELQLKEMAGQVVQKGALIAKVFDLRKLTVEIAVPESEIADIKVGQNVILKVRAYPNQTFNGFVTSVATNALSEASVPEAAPVTHTSSAGAEAVKTILVTTEIDNSSLLLKPGMTGHAKILCGRRRLLDLVTRRLAHTVKVQFWSWF